MADSLRGISTFLHDGLMASEIYLKDFAWVLSLYGVKKIEDIMDGRETTSTEPKEMQNASMTASLKWPRLKWGYFRRIIASSPREMSLLRVFRSTNVSSCFEIRSKTMSPFTRDKGGRSEMRQPENINKTMTIINWLSHYCIDRVILMRTCCRLLRGCQISAGDWLRSKSRYSVMHND